MNPEPNLLLWVSSLGCIRDELNCFMMMALQSKYEIQINTEYVVCTTALLFGPLWREILIERATHVGRSAGEYLVVCFFFLKLAHKIVSFSTARGCMQLHLWSYRYRQHVCCTSLTPDQTRRKYQAKTTSGAAFGCPPNPTSHPFSEVDQHLLRHPVDEKIHKLSTGCVQPNQPCSV